MATWTRYGYYGGSAWNDIGTNNVAFTGSSGYTDSIAVNSWQDKTFVVDGTPGNEVAEINNTKFVSSSEFDKGGGGTAINDTNCAQTDCTFRWKFAHGTAVALQNMELYAYDGGTDANPAPNVEIQAFEQGEGATAWTEINDASASVGGTGNAMSLGTRAAGTAHYYYFALSWSGETAGAKTGAAIKISGEYY